MIHSIRWPTPPLPRRTLPLALVASLAWWSPDAMASAIYLNWDECRHQGAGTDDQQAVCFSDQGQSDLYCSFELDQVLDDVVGVEVTVDLQHAQDPIPLWWNMLGKGMCRDGSLFANGNFLANEVCTDPWRDLGGAIALFDPGLPRGRGSQARLRGVYAIRSDSARTLVPGVHYYALKLVIRNDRTLFPSTCTGCGEPACLVLNRVTLLRGLGSEPAEVGLETPGPGLANRVTWRGGAAASCAAVPARRVTWGAVRALYR